MLAREIVQEVIGKGFADKLDEYVFESGSILYTRREMVEKIGCANFIAAAKLAKVLRRLQIHTPTQLYKLDPHSLARSRGIGEAAIFVAMCILEANDFDVMKWWEFSGATTKFSSFKHNAIRKSRSKKQEVA